MFMEMFEKSGVRGGLGTERMEVVCNYLYLNDYMYVCLIDFSLKICFWKCLKNLVCGGSLRNKRMEVVCT